MGDVNVGLAMGQPGQVVHHRSRVWMVGTEGLFSDRNRLLQYLSCARELALGRQDGAQAYKALGCNEMVGAKNPLADAERALVKLPRAGKVALEFAQASDTAQARCGRWMVWAKHFFVNLQCPLAEWNGGC